MTDDKIEECFERAIELKKKMAACFVDMYREIHPEHCHAEDLMTLMLSGTMLVAGAAAAILTPEDFQDIGGDKSKSADLEDEFFEKLSVHAMTLLAKYQSGSSAKKMSDYFERN